MLPIITAVHFTKMMVFMKMNSGLVLIVCMITMWSVVESRYGFNYRRKMLGNEDLTDFEDRHVYPIDVPYEIDRYSASRYKRSIQRSPTSSEKVVQSFLNYYANYIP